jgi:hypothetical protein
VVAAQPALAQTRWFAAQLSGDNAVGSPGDADGWGVGVVGLGDGVVWYHLWVTDISEPSAAHIHTGVAGASGGVFIDFGATFTEVDSDTYLATGSVAADTATISSVLDAPAAFYFNVHNADHTGGALRAQVLGSGASSHALAGTLRGTRQVDNPGDPDGTGYGSVVFDDGVAHYFLAVEDVDEPTAAHIHTGTATENGGVVVDFDATFSDGVATGAVAVDEDLAAEILGAPDQFYFNVHNDEFPTGAVRGQLRTTETVFSFAAVSRAKGQAGAEWGTSVRLLSGSDEAVTVYAEWYPSNDDGLTEPDQTVEVGIGAGSTAVIDDVVSTLFGADGNGGMRVLGSEPFVGAAKIFNDQRDNPEIGGTFGQHIPASTVTGMPTSGALLLLSNRPASQAAGFRTNLGYFNPNPFSVDVMLDAWTAGGGMMGSDTMTLAPYSNEVTGVFRLIPSVPSPERTVDDFTVTYWASAPVLMYASVVDNVTNDPIYVFPVPFSVPQTTSESENRPPNGTITAPTGDVTISEDESVVFGASAEDPDGDDMTYLWNFGDGITSTDLSPGAHTYTDSGTYTVTFTVTDSNGASDPSPDTRTITVESGGSTVTFTAIQNEIFTPSCALSGCHNSGSQASGLDLSAGAAYGNIVDVASAQQPSLDRIEPDEPSESYLYLKVTGDSSISGSRMPLGRPALSGELIDLLRDWIEDGAPDN